jgi:hypothetical protein
MIKSVGSIPSLIVPELSEGENEEGKEERNQSGRMVGALLIVNVPITYKQ